MSWKEIASAVVIALAVAGVAWMALIGIWYLLVEGTR